MSRQKLEKIADEIIRETNIINGNGVTFFPPRVQTNQRNANPLNEIIRNARDFHTILSNLSEAERLELLQGLIRSDDDNDNQNQSSMGRSGSMNSY